jgi:hypothetical protein
MYGLVDSCYRKFVTLLCLLLQLLEIAPLELQYTSGGNLLHALLEMRSPEVRGLSLEQAVHA